MLKPDFSFFNGSTEDRANVEAAFAQLNSLAAVHAGVASVLQAFTVVPVKFDASRFQNGGTAIYVRKDGGGSYIAVNPGHTSGSQTDTAGNTEPYADRSFARTLFHELFHAATIVSSEDEISFQLPQNAGINLNEAAAIFAENLLFAPVADEEFRMGHVNWNLPVDGNPGPPRNSTENSTITGMSAFGWITSTVGPTFSNTSAGPSFSLYSDDGILGVTKTYLKSDAELGHYIQLVGQNNAGFLSFDKSKTSYGDGLQPMIQSMMGGGTAAVDAASSIVGTLYKDYNSLGLANISLHRILGVGGDTYYDRAKDSDKTYVFSGVNFRIHNKYHEDIGGFTASEIAISAAGSDQNVLIVGAGNAGTMPTSSDILTGGEGSDFLVSVATGGRSVLNGGGGDDIIFGAGVVGDVLSGGGGNDILIGRTKGAFYDGGGDNDVLSYHHLGSSAPITLNVNFHAVSSRFGTDNYASIETLIGTPGGDVFNLAGGHPVIYGGAGSDKFYGIPTAFIYGGLGIDILDLWDGSGGVIDGTLLNSIETIYGSGGNDILTGNVFRNAQSTATFLGYGGNDIIEQSGTININIDGGAGDDTVIVLGESYGYLRGGIGFDTLDFSQLQANKLIVALSGANGTYTINTGSAHSFSSFEEVKFGSVTLRLQGSGTFTAGTGHNTVSGSDGVDDVTVGGTGGYVRTYGGDDIVHSTGLESVYGELGNDRLFAGDAVGGKLNGGVYPDQAVTWVDDGDDYLQGGAMADTLSGGTGTNELHGGGGYDHFYSGGYGENSVYGDADLGAMHYSFVARGGSPVDPDLVSIEDMGGWFDVVTTSDHGQTYRTDHLYDIDKVYFEGTHFDLEVGFTYYNPDFLI